MIGPSTVPIPPTPRPIKPERAAILHKVKSKQCKVKSILHKVAGEVSKMLRTLNRVKSILIKIDSTLHRIGSTLFKVHLTLAEMDSILHKLNLNQHRVRSILNKINLPPPSINPQSSFPAGSSRDGCEPTSTRAAANACSRLAKSCGRAA
jgi:hypothetical protein